MGPHVHDCMLCAGHIAEFGKTTAIFKSTNQTTRELVEAARIARAGDNCISMPSKGITQKEIAFLEAMEKRTWQ